MKTLKILSIISILAIIFGCNPNKELYEELDAQKEPYHESFSYTLKDEDYSTIKDLALQVAENADDSAKAKAIGTYKSFAADRPASQYVPLFLANKFLALDSSSAIKVFYNYDYTYIFPYERIIKSYTDTLTQNSTDFDRFIPLVDSLFPDAQDNDKVLVLFVDTTYRLQIGGKAFIYSEDDGGWLPTDSYFLLFEDYEAMGEPGPAEHRNFSADYPPENYLPIFLSLKYPYAQEGDEKEIVYKYYNGQSVEYHYTKYLFYDGAWHSKEIKSDNFIHNGETWIYDPTIRFTMTCDDYQIIVDWVKNNDTLSGYMHPQYDNTEFYFGASSYYCNFDMRVYKRRDYDVNHYLDNLSDEEALQVLFDRLQQAIEIVLETKFPTAQPIVNGVQLYAEVTFQTYEPGRYNYKMKFKCVDVGKFEYVEGSLTKLE